MTANSKFGIRIGLHRWSWLCLALAFLFALPALLILCNPVFHAVGMKELASAGDNLKGSTNNQKATMGSAAAAAAAAAAAGTDRSPMTPLNRQPSTSSEDSEPRNPFEKKTGSGRSPSQYDPTKTTGSSTTSGSSSEDGTSWKDWFVPDWWPWK